MILFLEMAKIETFFGRNLIINVCTNKIDRYKNSNVVEKALEKSFTLDLRLRSKEVLTHTLTFRYKSGFHLISNECNPYKKDAVCRVTLDSHSHTV